MIKLLEPIHLIFAGDNHYDLKTEGIDRNIDISNAKQQAIKYAVELKESGVEVYFIEPGDIFHGVRPRAESIALAISDYKQLDSEGIPTYLVAGNHDVIDERGKTSALEPIIAAQFSMLNVYHDIELVKIREGLNLITLPHISKARAAEEGYKNVQEFIDHKSALIEKRLNPEEYNIVIGHLNITGATVGTEEFMIKGAHEDFPNVLRKSSKISYIFNGHYHKAQIISNPDGAPIIITGSISINDFGERTETKAFFDLEVEI
ncbi:MAG: sbcD [Sedimentibacter sp.]|nr:sbcD [Sedimentibacter sp.]